MATSTFAFSASVPEPTTARSSLSMVHTLFGIAGATPRA
jgi:hypothetical protein